MLRQQACNRRCRIVRIKALEVAQQLASNASIAGVSSELHEANQVGARKRTEFCGYAHAFPERIECVAVEAIREQAWQQLLRQAVRQSLIGPALRALVQPAELGERLRTLGEIRRNALPSVLVRTAAPFRVDAIDVLLTSAFEIRAIVGFDGFNLIRIVQSELSTSLIEKPANQREQREPRIHEQCNL